ncbi:hypothetical protein [Rhodoferax sp.]|uniref:hypothetical protein n=1 Tax=Rhodoferax sp. TaxID=50421 RepID=UPI00374D242D
MTKRTAERTLEISYSTGTGPLKLARPVVGYRTLADAGCVDGDTVDLIIDDVSSTGIPTGDWEMGTYTWGAGGVLTRTTITASSNGGAAVNWSNGTRWVRGRSAATVDGGGSSTTDKAANLRLFNHTLIDFSPSDAATGWSTSGNQTVAYDAVNKGLRIKGNGVSGVNIITTKTLPRTLAPAQIQRIAVKIRSNSPGLQAGIYLQVGDGTNFTTLGSFSLIQIPASDHPDWHWAVWNTAEDATAWGNLTTVSQLRFRTNTQAAPYLNDLTIAKIVINPQTVSPFAMTFDDGWDSSYTVALPILAAAGVPGTVFIPNAGAPGVAANRRITPAQSQSLGAASWGVCDDGSDDDSVLTGAATPEAAVAKFQNGQYLGLSLGTKKTDLNYLCWPNGLAWIAGTPVQIAAATSNESNVVTLGAAATVVAGSAYYGANVPDGTTVTVGGAGVTSITVSNNIPAGTIAAACVDLTSPFTYAALASRLSAIGVRGARLTGLGDASIIEGFQNPMFITGISFTGVTLNQALVTLNTLKNRGVAIVPYTHEVVADPGGWTADTPNTSINAFASFIAGVAAWAKTAAAAGELELFAFPAMVEKYRS